MRRGDKYEKYDSGEKKHVKRKLKETITKRRSKNSKREREQREKSERDKEYVHSLQPHLYYNRT